MRTLLFCLLAFSTTAAFADTTDPWTKLLNYTMDKGEVMQPDNGPTLVSIARITPPDKSVPHVAEYFSVAFQQDNNGQLQPVGTSEVSEDWQIDKDGNWQVTQWIFLSTIAGIPMKAMKGTIVETMNGQVLVAERTEVPLTDAAAKAKWDSNLVDWQTYAGSNSLASR